LLLARATGLPNERCVALLSDACAARVVTLTGPGEYRFVHDLNREVLYAALSPSERPVVHLAIGRALAALPAFQDARQAAVLAHHFLEAAHVGGADSALDLSIRAGAYALRNFAYEEAIEHFERANRLLPLAAERDPATECAVLLDLGLARISAGEREAGQSTLLAAAEKARQLGGASELALVALHLAPGLFAIETGVYDPVLVSLLREAIAQAGQLAPGRQALMLARLALALYWSDTFDERVALCQQARALAEQDGSDQVRGAVATANIFALLRPSNLDERRALSEQAVELCQRAGDHDGLLMNRVLRAAMFMESADMAAARFETEAFRALAETTSQPQSLWIVKAQQASRLLLDGRLDEVEQLAGACLATGQRVRDHNALLTFGVHLTFVRIEQLRVTEVLEVIRDFSARYPRIVAWRVLYAFALLRAGGQLPAAQAEYRSLQGAGFALPDDLNWMCAMALLAELSRAFGDADDQRCLYERLAPYAGRLVVIGYAGIACLGSVEMYLALLASSFADRDVIQGHFERALDANRRASATLPLLYALCDYAEWLNSIGSSALARACVEEARPLIEERNLTALRARLEIVSPPTAPAPTA
jgi:predicted ATPase